MEMFVKWFVVVLIALGIISSIASIDEEREQISKGDAILKLIFNGGIIYMIIRYL